MTGAIDTEKSQPEDRGRLVMIVFYYLGVTVLLPQYMLITLSEFWMNKFKDPDLPSNSTQLSELQKNIPGYLSITGNVPVALAVLVTAVWGSRISVKKRMLLSGAVEAITFALLTLLTGIDFDSNQSLLLVLVLTVSSLYSLGSGVFQATYFGNNARFPSRYIGCACDGTGLGCALPALISVGIIAMNPALEATGPILTGIATLLLLLILPSYYWVSNTKFYQHYSTGSTNLEGSSSLGFKEFFQVIKATYNFFFIIFYNFALNLSVHPAVTALVKPEIEDPESTWKSKYFLTICCFLLQAASEWIGRSLATLTQWPPPGQAGEVFLMTAVLARTGFIPLLMFCNIAPHNRTLPVIFSSDWHYVVLIVTFNILGGFIVNCGMMLAPKKVSSKLQEAVGSFLITAIVCGLGFGSLIGPALVSCL